MQITFKINKTKEEKSSRAVECQTFNCSVHVNFFLLSFVLVHMYVVHVCTLVHIHECVHTCMYDINVSCVCTHANSLHSHFKNKTIHHGNERTPVDWLKDDTFTLPMNHFNMIFAIAMLPFPYPLEAKPQRLPIVSYN